MNAGFLPGDAGVEGVDLEAVEVLLRFRELLAVVDLHRELAAGFLGQPLGHVLRTLGKRPPLAPGGESPAHFRAIDFGLSHARCGIPGQQRDRGCRRYRQLHRSQ